MGYFVEVESGVHLYVEDINPESSEAVVFLHGWPLSHKQFEYQFNVLPAQGYRCIGIDWRGSDIRISRWTATVTTAWLMTSALWLMPFS